MQEVPTGRRRKWLLILAEAALVLAIAGLMVATWLPAILAEDKDKAGESATAPAE